MNNLVVQGFSSSSPFITTWRLANFLRINTGLAYSSILGLTVVSSSSVFNSRPNFMISSDAHNHGVPNPSWTCVLGPATNEGITDVVAADDGSFIAIGVSGGILRSTDGYSWNTVTSPVTTKLNTIRNIAGDLYAVGDSGKLIKSVNDGVNWSLISSATLVAALLDIASRNGGTELCISGTSGQMYRSTDSGSTWASVTTGTTGNLNSIASNGSVYCAVGWTGSAAVILTSTTGVTWTAQTAAITANPINSIEYSIPAGQFMAAGSTVASGLQYSATGTAWTAATTSGNPANTFNRVRDINGRFIAVVNTSNGTYKSNATGNTWFESNFPSIPAKANIYIKQWNKFLQLRQFAGVGLSSNGQIWSRAASPGISSSTMRDVAYSPTLDRACAVGLSGAIRTTTAGQNGESWENAYTLSGLPNLQGIVWDSSSGVFFCCGSGGSLYSSSTGFPSSWTTVASGTANQLNAIAVKDSTVCAVGIGSPGVITTKVGAGTFTLYASNAPASLNGIAASSTLFCAVGDSGGIVTSPDGLTWTARASGTTQALYDVIFVKNKFVAVGNLGVVLVSSDGIGWTSKTLPTTELLVGIAASSSRLVISGNVGLTLVTDI